MVLLHHSGAENQDSRRGAIFLAWAMPGLQSRFEFGLYPPPSQASRRLSDTEQHCGLGLSTAGRATKRPERRIISVRPARLHRAVTAEYCAELNAGISRRRFLRRTGLWSDYNPDGETLNSYGDDISGFDCVLLALLASD